MMEYQKQDTLPKPYKYALHPQQRNDPQPFQGEVHSFLQDLSHIGCDCLDQEQLLDSSFQSKSPEWSMLDNKM